MCVVISSRHIMFGKGLLQDSVCGTEEITCRMSLHSRSFGRVSDNEFNFGLLDVDPDIMSNRLVCMTVFKVTYRNTLSSAHNLNFLQLT